MPDNQDSKELLPCPFCGDVDENMKPILGQRGSRRAVICQHCGVQGGAGSTDEFAISNWNDRPASKQLTATQQALEAMKIGMKENQAWAKNAISDYGIIKGQLDSAVEALKFYADENNWEGGFPRRTVYRSDMIPYIVADDGYMAQAALASVRSK